MSDLLNSASLVMIPSGYKEDTVYSVVPSDGSGDLSFTRASNGTRVNSAGLVEVVAWNLVEYSEQFDNAAWTKYQSTVTSNTTTAPNGTLTADAITDNSSNSPHLAYQDRAGIVAGMYTISVYAKASTLSYINLQWYDGSTAYTSNIFNLSNGTTTGANQSIESVGNGWYRCVFTFTTTVSGLQYAYVMLNDGTGVVYVGTGQSVFIWGYQLNIGSTAKPYFPTTDRLNVPRLTYQNGGGGCPSLLLEKQSTNLFTYSEQLQTGTSGTVTVTPNTAISPDGTQNADSLSTSGYLSKSLSATAGTYTYSVFAKYLSENTVQIYIYDGVYYNATYNVSTGVVSSASSGVTASMQNLGNGWYRCIMTATTANNVSEVGFDSGNVYAWGCQFEAGSYPTSYIPTTSASATRVADECSKTGISSLIGQTEGVIFYDGVLTGISNLYANLINSEKNVTGSFSIGQNNTGSILAALFVNGNAIVNFNYGSFAVDTRTKIAFAYKSGSFALYVNGTQLATSAATFTPIQNMDDIFIGDVTTYFNYKENTQVNQVALFSTRLTNAELASLTTI